jgi:hypothetical protein
MLHACHHGEPGKDYAYPWLSERKKDEDPTEAQLAMQTDASTAFRIP